MQRIIPNIWCNRTAREAGEFYASAIPNTTSAVTARYPSEGLPDFQAAFAGEPLTVDVVTDGFRITLINAGSEFTPNPSISFILNFDPLFFEGNEDAARSALDHTWNALSVGGSVLMPLQEYPFSKQYGWVQDRYGVSWQLMLTDPTGDPRPWIIPQLMFGGPVDGMARAAVEKYVDLMPDAALGTVLPTEDGRVMFGEFRVGEQWFSVMDGGSDQEFTFGCGVSLEVDCDGQAEIDRLWDALSAVPEAEQCGWLADEFGVSWQIVPSNMAELMQRPGAYEHMMTMGKLIIDDF